MFYKRYHIPHTKKKQNPYYIIKVTTMAGVLGFEPRDAEIKTRCLTAWRYPNTNFS